MRVNVAGSGGKGATTIRVHAQRAGSAQQLLQCVQIWGTWLHLCFAQKPSISPRMCGPLQSFHHFRRKFTSFLVCCQDLGWNRSPNFLPLRIYGKIHSPRCSCSKDSWPVLFLRLFFRKWSRSPAFDLEISAVRGSVGTLYGPGVGRVGWACLSKAITGSVSTWLGKLRPELDIDLNPVSPSPETRTVTGW
jgi:hypothetical protein